MGINKSSKMSGAGGKTPWSKIASKGSNPADGFTKGKFSKGKSTATKGKLKVSGKKGRK